MFFFVIQVGVARNDGTLPLPLLVVPFVFRLALEQRERDRGGTVGLELDGLVHRPRLPARR